MGPRSPEGRYRRVSGWDVHDEGNYVAVGSSGRGRRDGVPYMNGQSSYSGGGLVLRTISENCIEKKLTNIDRLAAIQERIVWHEAWQLGSQTKKTCVYSGKRETFPGPY
jgi:hypothetical protein